MLLPPWGADVPGLLGLDGVVPGFVVFGFVLLGPVVPGFVVFGVVPGVVEPGFCGFVEPGVFVVPGGVPGIVVPGVAVPAGGVAGVPGGVAVPGGGVAVPAGGVAVPLGEVGVPAGGVAVPGAELWPAVPPPPAAGADPPVVLCATAQLAQHRITARRGSLVFNIVFYLILESKIAAASLAAHGKYSLTWSIDGAGTRRNPGNALG